MRQLFSFLLFAGCAATALNVDAQQCTGSLGAPIINETFGHGSNATDMGDALPDGYTSMTFIKDACVGSGPDLPNGQYAILSSMGSSCKGGTWQSIPQDNTGDPHGYMMVINASATPSTFYTQRVDVSKLCTGAKYYFGAFVANILRDLPQTQGYAEPNLTFSIEDLNGKDLVPPVNTGYIKAESGPLKWIPVGVLFTAPTTDFYIRIKNNSPGSLGNDLALDDITVSPCGPLIKTGFDFIGNVTTKNACASGTLNYTLVSDQDAYSNPVYQWQYRTTTYDDWQNVTSTDATNLILHVNLPYAAAAAYQYRVGVLPDGSMSPNCRVYSDPLTIDVFPNPVSTLSTTTSGCVGYPLMLSSGVSTVYPTDLSISGPTDFEWTGPNGYSATGDNPIVTLNADASYNGVYTVKITKNGCPSFSNTTVTVTPPATITSTSTNSVDVCEGGVTQLSVDAKNATTYKWVPTTGLDHDDIANPIASPAVTTTYEVTVSNGGCPDVVPYADITVNVLKKPQANAGQTIKIFSGQSVKLNGTANGDQVNYYWTPNLYMNNSTNLTPTVTPPQDITYTLHVVSNTTCGESTSGVFVRVYQLLTIPNTFTPNGDGINDKWEIKNLTTYPNALLSIYNRNGQPVFQNRGGSTAWDGTYNGSPLPVGTYYYVIDLQEDDLPKPAGWVLIVR